MFVIATLAVRSLLHVSSSFHVLLVRVCAFEQVVKGRRPSVMGVLAGSNRDDDLADLPARFEIMVRIDNLVEWKHSVDDWL